MKSLDLFIILIFIVVISIIVGLNIVSVIDKKLGSIEINVPPVNVPKPTLVLKIDKDNLDEYDVSVLNRSDRTEHFNGGEKLVPSQTITTKMTNNNTGEGSLKNPADNDVVEYGPYVCYRKGKQPAPLKVDLEPVPKVTCKNESLNRKFATGPNQLEKSPVGYQHDTSEIDPATYYKKTYDPPVAQLEDPNLEGYNIGSYVNNYSGYAGIFDIGNINLKNDRRYPTPNNYILRSPNPNLT